MVKNTLNGLKHSLYDWISARHNYNIIKLSVIKFKKFFLLWVHGPCSITMIEIRIKMNMAYLRKEKPVIQY